MLARVADNLYWMSRYLERADQTARLIRVQVGTLADRPAAQVADGWRRMFRSLSTPKPKGEFFHEGDDGDGFLLADAFSLTDYMTFEAGNSHSVASLWRMSRENARQARQEITSEMWGELNRSYLQIRSERLESVWNREPERFFRDLSARIYLFRGVTDNSLRHGESWDFIRLGRFMERLQTTVGILDSWRPALEAEDTVYDGTILLRQCASFEPYCRRHTAVIEPARAIRFLIYEPESPHTLRFSVEQLDRALARVDPAGGRHPLKPPHRLAGRLRALLAYRPEDSGSVEETLNETRRIARDLHDEIYRHYVFYPADRMLRPRSDDSRR